MNRKGDIQSLIYAVVMIFALGIVIFFFSHVNDQMYDSLDNYLESSTKYNNSEANVALNTIIDVEQSIWDYAFLIIVLGIVLSLALTAFATRINVAFYWIYAIYSIVVFVVGVMVSNIWQEAAAAPEFVETIARFPITNTLLGTYYPLVVLFIIVLTMILLFGKIGEDTR